MEVEPTGAGFAATRRAGLGDQGLLAGTAGLASTPLLRALRWADPRQPGTNIRLVLLVQVGEVAAADEPPFQRLSLRPGEIIAGGECLLGQGRHRRAQPGKRVGGL